MEGIVNTKMGSTLFSGQPSVAIPQLESHIPVSRRKQIIDSNP